MERAAPGRVLTRTTTDMARLPKAARIEILIDEPTVARGIVDRYSARVKLRWRGPETDSPLIAALEELADLDDVMVLKRADGGVELVPASWRGIRLGKEGPRLYELAKQTPGGLGTAPVAKEASEYASKLIRHYLPDFDSYSPKEQADFLQRTIVKLKKVADGYKELEAHLQYALPEKRNLPGGRKAVKPIEKPDQAIQAAILRDVMGWSFPRIGEALGISPSPTEKYKNDNRKVRTAINRGRPLLEQCFGVEGWRERIERMRTMRERWVSMGPKQQLYTLISEAHGTSLEEEERAAKEDGFDAVVDEWIEAAVQDDNERRLSIEASDSRFDALYAR